MINGSTMIVSFFILCNHQFIYISEKKNPCVKEDTALSFESHIAIVKRKLDSPPDIRSDVILRDMASMWKTRPTPIFQHYFLLKLI